MLKLLLHSDWLLTLSALLVFASLDMESEAFQYNWVSGDGNFSDFDDGTSNNASNDSVTYHDQKYQNALLANRPTARVVCSANSTACCAEPYVPINNQGKFHCCKPNPPQPSAADCCPWPLIPSKEPNVHPSFGPFCCDPSTGHCCKRDTHYGRIVYPSKGRCCIDTSCCPRPLVPRNRGSLCCSHTPDQYDFFCCPSHWIFNWPIPRCCSPRGFCCPLPYNVRISNNPALTNDKCFGPAASCTLPFVPNPNYFNSCMAQQPLPLPLNGKDAPEYDLSYPKFSNRDPKRTVVFKYPQCTRAEVIREIFGNGYYVRSVQASAVPVNWFVTRTQTQRMKQILNNDTSLNQKVFSWPELILPFLFPISITAVGIASIIPLLLLSAIGWAVLYNCRFLAHKRIRMAIRKFLIWLEKRRRDFQYGSLPAADLRKVRQQDRYQMPKTFQNSDLSSDDEPAELQTDEGLYWDGDTESLWTPEEIHRLGFDPDRIPLEWIYGDILGKPEELKPEVRNYNSRQVGRTGDRAAGGTANTAGEGLDSEEWQDFISCRAKDKAKKEEGLVTHNIRETLRRIRRSSSRTPSSSQILTEANSKRFKKGTGIKKGKRK